MHSQGITVAEESMATREMLLFQSIKNSALKDISYDDNVQIIINKLEDISPTAVKMQAQVMTKGIILGECTAIIMIIVTCITGYEKYTSLLPLQNPPSVYSIEFPETGKKK